MKCWFNTSQWQFLHSQQCRTHCLHHCRDFFSDDLNPDVTPTIHWENVSTTSSPNREFRYVICLFNSYSLSLTIPLKTEQQPRISELMSSVGKPLPLTMLHLKVVKALLILNDASSDDVGKLHSICAQHNSSRGYWVPDSKQKCQHSILTMDLLLLRLCYHFFD